MRKLLFLFILLGSYHLTQGQDYQYQVAINNHRTGGFSQSTEVDQSIHTFAALDFQVLTLTDTLAYTSITHFIESDSGFLKSVSWTQTLVDTLSYEVSFTNDTITYLNLSDSSKTKHPSSSIIFGPEKIRVLSKELLDTIGSKICFKTFSTALNQIIEVQRELISYSIEKAQKLKVVKETVGSEKSTISTYDRDFYLIQAVNPSPFGEIKLTRVNKIRNAQFFESDFFQRKRLLSNIRIPDPKNISSMKLSIEGLDPINPSAVIDHNQKMTTADSTSLTLIVTNAKKEWLVSDTVLLASPEVLWSSYRTKIILDSLALDSLDSKQKLEKISSYASASSTYPNLALYQLASALQIPSRIVYGYVYDQWFWSAKVWTELVIDGVWVAQNLSSETQSNSALKIALYKSPPNAILSSIYFEDIPDITNIQVQAFTLDGKKHSVSSQVLPYYFESPVYENEGLGIRINIPDGFEISNDGTTSPSPVFLALANSYQEKITFSQNLTQSEETTEQSAKKRIHEFLGDEHISLNKDKKLDLWYGFLGQRGAIAIPQGSSYIFIAIEHEDPEFTILVLTRKNLDLKY